jgi:hypothetical protein
MQWQLFQEVCPLPAKQFLPNEQKYLTLNWQHLSIGEERAVEAGAEAEGPQGGGEGGAHRDGGEAHSHATDE